MLGNSVKLDEWVTKSPIRNILFQILGRENSKGNPVYVSKLTELYNKSVAIDTNCVTNSTIRRKIQIFKEHKIVKAINEGGRPEYLELTELGNGLFKILSSKEIKPNT